MIALATTTITVLRPPAGVDPYEAEAVPIVTGVRATIGSPSGRDAHIGGDQSVVTAKLNCDPCGLRSYDQVRDETTDVLYEVVWVEDRCGLGLDHVEAGLRRVEGASNG